MYNKKIYTPRNSNKGLENLFNEICIIEKGPKPIDIIIKDSDNDELNIKPNNISDWNIHIEKDKIKRIKPVNFIEKFIDFDKYKTKISIKDFDIKYKPFGEHDVSTKIENEIILGKPTIVKNPNARVIAYNFGKNITEKDIQESNALRNESNPNSLNPLANKIENYLGNPLEQNYKDFQNQLLEIETNRKSENIILTDDKLISRNDKYHDYLKNQLKKVLDYKTTSRDDKPLIVHSVNTRKNNKLQSEKGFVKDETELIMKEEITRLKNTRNTKIKNIKEQNTKEQKIKELTIDEEEKLKEDKINENNAIEDKIKELKSYRKAKFKIKFEPKSLKTIELEDMMKNKEEKKLKKIKAHDEHYDKAKKFTTILNKITGVDHQTKRDALLLLKDDKFKKSAFDVLKNKKMNFREPDSDSDSDSDTASVISISGTPKVDNRTKINLDSTQQEEYYNIIELGKGNKFSPQNIMDLNKLFPNDTVIKLDITKKDLLKHLKETYNCNINLKKKTPTK